MKIYLISSIVILMSICFGCKKSDSPISDLSLNRVKIYDDTTASIQNSSIHIASGAGRMYMSYGVGKTRLIESNSGGYYLILVTKINSNDLSWLNQNLPFIN